MTWINKQTQKRPVNTKRPKIVNVSFRDTIPCSSVSRGTHFPLVLGLNNYAVCGWGCNSVLEHRVAYGGGDSGFHPNTANLVNTIKGLGRWHRR